MDRGPVDLLLQFDKFAGKVVNVALRFLNLSIALLLGILVHKHRTELDGLFLELCVL